MDKAIESAWRRLEEEGNRLGGLRLRDLFAADAERFERFSVSLDDCLIDFSKEKIDLGALDALLALAEVAGVESRRDAMMGGEAINLTEGRAVLHAALRGGAPEPVTVAGRAVGPDIRETLDRAIAFAEDIRGGIYTANDGRPFTDVINIGIGGSDLGPAMATRALFNDADGPRVHFVSNVDGAHLADLIGGLDPRRTLVIVASKTFTTLETMTNARSAKDWLAATLGAAADGHLAAVSTNMAATSAFGIADERVFGFWDWVGGRYSVWSAIGLPIMIAVGGKRFRAFLDGAADMDRHFRTAPLAQSLPVLLALIGIWRRNVMGWPTVALIPYDQRLERFPAYVQQLDMESNGKRVTREGAPVEHSTGPVVWGEPGTNAQHSFFQLLHQGTDVVPVDFIAAVEPREALGDHHALLLANCLAQAQALAFGKDETSVRDDMRAQGRSASEIDRLAAHRTFPGDRPSTTIMHRRLDPHALGRLVALYEHKIFVQGVIWNVNSFDQWGVELGKELAMALIPSVKGEGDTVGLDSSTAGLIAYLHKRQK
jgi:glucose-6-phosphate isomerase